MGDRISDERLADIDGALAFAGVNLLGALNDEIRSALDELRERRAADLKSFERMVVEVWRDRLVTDDTIDRSFIAVLDRLLGGKP